MKNILIKSVLAGLVICNSVSYSALNTALNSNTANIKLQKQKNQVINKSNNKAVYITKYKETTQDLQEVKKEDKDKQNKDGKDGKNLVNLDAFKFKISGYATFCGAAASNKHVYYDGENVPKELNIQKEDNKDNIVKSYERTKTDKDGLDLIAGEAGIKFNADGELENNLKYGALLEIQAEKEDIDIDKAFLYFKGDNIGTFRGGNFKGTDNDFVFSGQQLLLANFGIDGIITSQLDYATGCLNPRGPIGFSNKATKFDYCSPDLYGFKLGLSYTPDTKHMGHDKRDRTIGDKSTGNNSLYAKGEGEKEKPCGRHNIALGIKFDKDFGNDFKVRTGLVFITEKTQEITTNCYSGDINSETKPESKKIKLNNAKSWIASLELTYKKLTIAGGYYNSGKSRLPQADEYSNDNQTILIPAFMTNKDGDAGYAWNIGAKIKITDKFALTGVYHNASRKITKDAKATANVFTLAADYDINKHFKLFGEVDILKSKSSNYACALYNLNHKKDSKNALLQTNSVLFSAGMVVFF